MQLYLFNAKLGYVHEYMDSQKTFIDTELDSHALWSGWE